MQIKIPTYLYTFYNFFAENQVVFVQKIINRTIGRTRNMLKHAINYWDSSIVYAHFEGVLWFCNSSEACSKCLQLIKK